PSSAPSAAPRPRSTATSPRGTTATLWSNGSASRRTSWAWGPTVRGSVSDTHYRFPPASAYPLNRCLYALKSDDAFRARFLADAKAAMAEHGLDAESQTALLAADRDALVARGAHPYLVFMADLRLRMARGTGTF